MAGGSGTRFWPASRATLPKQLLPIGGTPLVVATVERLEGMLPAESIWLVTRRDQAEATRALLPQIPPAQILEEPCGRNTAACVGLAATAIVARDPDAVLACLPADHLVSPNEEFQRALQGGAEAAAKPGAFVTFGVPPTHPATGYGYIRRADPCGEFADVSAWEVDSFTEKPDQETAASFLQEGIYFWNAGIFVWRADTILAALAEHLPEIASGLLQLQGEPGSSEWNTVLDKIYPDFPSVPVDTGVMEKVAGVLVLETPFAWSDVGTWAALYEALSEDGQENLALLPGAGQLFSEDAKGVLAWADAETSIAVLGLDNVMVVRTGDAILVCARDRAEDVKALVERLRVEGREDLL